MGNNPENKLSDLVDIFRSWIPRRSEPANVSRDFWMPDQSCRVCYDCDSQFTVFNRRHHCRLCGRVFCAKCTANSIPSQSSEPSSPSSGREESERVRVCSYCYRQWDQRVSSGVDNGASMPSNASPGLSPSPSATSLVSTKSSCTFQSSSSTAGSAHYSTGPYQHVPSSSSLSPRRSAQMDHVTVPDGSLASQRSVNLHEGGEDSLRKQYSFCNNRSDDEDDDYHSDSETRHFAEANDYYGALSIDDIDQVYESHSVHQDQDNIVVKSFGESPLPDSYDALSIVETRRVVEEAAEHDTSDERHTPSYNDEGKNAEPVDFENDGLLWIPPEPEDEEDDREAVLFDDDDDDKDDGAIGEWGYLRSSSSFGSGEYRNKEKSGDEHRNAMKNVVDGHFKALVAQLLHVEDLPVGDSNDKESWLEIVTSLSWEAATLLKPDMSKGGGMDPGGYVKIKCIACGRRSESMVVKGVVCKKNVAHRRMTSKIDKPRFLILGGALEYQRVSNLLSSFDTLLQQEMDHLKMAVAKIDAHHPNVLLVEKSVSRYAQEYLLAKNISLVLNIKRPLLERIARCTGAQIVSSIDHMTSPKLGYCDLFHVEKLVEEHGSAGQDGKKLTKTLMFFEGCPKPLGCTVLLKGASGEELKKVKHVIQYGVFAAYHLALETSFLADEGALIPELPLKSPITVALPDKPSGIDRSISTIPGYNVPQIGKPNYIKDINETDKNKKGTTSESGLPTNCNPCLKLEMDYSPSCVTPQQSPNSLVSAASFTSLSGLEQDNLSYSHNKGFPIGDAHSVGSERPDQVIITHTGEPLLDPSLSSTSFGTSKPLGHDNCTNDADGNKAITNQPATLDMESIRKTSNANNEGEPPKEEFPPSPSDHQSILVSLSTRSVWKGTVCERSHLLRIKYYGNFDKPLGRFLRDHLFDQSFHCRSCGMPSEAHVHCYTHRQGSLTISVKKFPELVLPGEKQGKIWMWHRCLKCPRTNGFPPATQRVVMSDAAWGLSFGKFLELSFSNHVAASRVASCGHSLHRDCLRFYGFGRMVACFRYASIDVLSVYLPPSKLDFYTDDQEWLQKEANEVHNQAALLFTEVQNAIYKISQKKAALEPDEGTRVLESKQRLAELEEMLQKKEEEFEESLQRALSKELKSGQYIIDILEINKLRRRILFDSYVWDQLLIDAASSNNKNLTESLLSSTSKLKEKSLSSVEKIIETSVASNPVKGFSSCDSSLSETKPDTHSHQQGNAGQICQPGGAQNCNAIGSDQSYKNENEVCISSGANINDKSDPLEHGESIRRAYSEGEYPQAADLSDTLDAAWTGEYPANITPKEDGYSSADSTLIHTVTAKEKLESSTLDQGEIETTLSFGSALPVKGPDNVESLKSLASLPIMNFSASFNKNLTFGAQELLTADFNPTYVSQFQELERQSGARQLLPIGVNDTVVPVYDDEPTSIVAYTLVSSKYRLVMSESEKPKETGDSSVSLPLFDSLNLLSLNSFDESVADTYRSFGSSNESLLSTSGSGSQVVDPNLYSKDLHARISFTDEGLPGKVKYTVTCYYAKGFEALRRICCPSELDFIRSLCRCKKWGAQGGKSNAFFAKTLDDRFIIKQVSKTELDSFIKFGPAYFKYLSESIRDRSPTCLAKILGIYQVSSKHVKGGKETKMDILVMENLLFRRQVTRLYDLKGSLRSRYNSDTSGSNKVLLDQNLIEAIPTSPIFVGNKAKRVLERAVWNDTSFLAAIDVMDYSLLVGVDEENHELVLGIIDFMRQYTWDKHLETWVKTSGFLGGTNEAPTVISPQQYKKRFRKAMSTYFIMVPVSGDDYP